MSHPLEFIIKLTDMFTPKMGEVGRVAESVATRVSNDLNKIDKTGAKLTSSIRNIKEELDAWNKVRSTTLIAKEFEYATREANKLEKQLQKLESKGKIGSGGSGSMLGNFVKGNLIAGGIQTALSTAKEFTIGSYDKALSNKGLSNAINTTTKGQGAEAMAQTKSIADKYGINYEASLEGVKTLTGGLMSMNIPLKEQMKIFEGVSTGVAAMGLTAEQSKGAMLALGQMASKGTVSAEELRGQLGERIPGAFGLAAKAMNVTEAQLNKMMQNGDIAAKDFLPRLAAQMQKTFGADALKNADGPQAVSERFNNALYNMQVTIGQGLMPIITPMLEVFTNLANTALPFISSGLNQVVNFISGINTEGGVWGVWFDVIKQVGIAVWNGVSHIAGTIWTIIKSVVQWAASSQMLQDIFWAIGKLAEGVFWVISKVGDAIGWIWKNTIMPILEAIEWVYKTVKGLLGGKTQLEVVQTLKVVKAPGLPGELGQGSPFVAGAPVTPISLNGGNSKKQDGATGGEFSRKGADSINSGGQRTIVINIGKQIEKLEVHVANAKEGADEIAAMVREELKRTFYALNGVAG